MHIHAQPGALEVELTDHLEKILALYSRGMSTRDIEAHLRELHGVSVGRDLISRVTEAVMDDVREWQQRPLEDVYPVLFLDCMVLKIRDGGSVQRRACYLALGIGMDGERDVLGMWFQDTEGAKFWMQVLTELKDRGVRDILICCVDGLEASTKRSRRSSRRPRCRRASCISSAPRCATSRAASTTP
jgi:putative transposase